MDKFDKLELDRASLQGLEVSYFDLGDRAFFYHHVDPSNQRINTTQGIREKKIVDLELQLDECMNG